MNEARSGGGVVYHWVGWLSRGWGGPEISHITKQTRTKATTKMEKEREEELINGSIRRSSIERERWINKLIATTIVSDDDDIIDLSILPFIIDRLCRRQQRAIVRHSINSSGSLGQNNRLNTARIPSITNNHNQIKQQPSPVLANQTWLKQCYIIKPINRATK